MRDWIAQATEADLEDLQRLVDVSADDGDSSRGEGDGKWTARTLGEVAAFLGLALQTVKDLRTGPDPMPGSEGNYPLAEIVRWRFAKLQHLVKPTGNKAEKEIASLDIDNARNMLRLRRESGELVDRKAAKVAVQQLFYRLRGQLQPLPEVLATAVPAGNRADFLLDARARIQALLTAIANWRFEAEVDGDSAPNNDPNS